MKLMALGAVSVVLLALLSAGCGYGSSGPGYSAKYYNCWSGKSKGKTTQAKIITVGGHECVDVFYDTTVYASGSAVVNAHNTVSVFAKGHATVTVFDTTVTCSTAQSVRVLYNDHAAGSDAYDLGLLNARCPRSNG